MEHCIELKQNLIESDLLLFEVSGILDLTFFFVIFLPVHSLLHIDNQGK